MGRRVGSGCTGRVTQQWQCSRHGVHWICESSLHPAKRHAEFVVMNTTESEESVKEDVLWLALILTKGR